MAKKKQSKKVISFKTKSGKSVNFITAKGLQKSMARRKSRRMASPKTRVIRVKTRSAKRSRSSGSEGGFKSNMITAVIMGAGKGAVQGVLNPIIAKIPILNAVPQSLAIAGIGLAAAKMNFAKKYALKLVEYNVYDASQNLLSMGVSGNIASGVNF